MFDTLLRKLLAPATDPLPAPEASLALAALLVRIARADGRYDADEVARIDRVLGRTFSLAPSAAQALRREAEALEAVAPDTVRFTRALKEAVAVQDRTALMQAMWEVVLADGVRDDGEDTLMRLVANLLGMTDVDSALARQRAEQQ